MPAMPRALDALVTDADVDAFLRELDLAPSALEVAETARVSQGSEEEVASGAPLRGRSRRRRADVAAAALRRRGGPAREVDARRERRHGRRHDVPTLPPPRPRRGRRPPPPADAVPPRDGHGGRRREDAREGPDERRHPRDVGRVAPPRRSPRADDGGPRARRRARLLAHAVPRAARAEGVPLRQEAVGGPGRNLLRRHEGRDGRAGGGGTRKERRRPGRRARLSRQARLLGTTRQGREGRTRVLGEIRRGAARGRGRAGRGRGRGGGVGGVGGGADTDADADAFAFAHTSQASACYSPAHSTNDSWLTRASDFGTRAPRGGGAPAAELVSIYHEDSGVPAAVITLGAMKGLAPYMRSLEEAVRGGKFPEEAGLLGRRRRRRMRDDDARKGGGPGARARPSPPRGGASSSGKAPRGSSRPSGPRDGSGRGKGGLGPPRDRRVGRERAVVAEARREASAAKDEGGRAPRRAPRRGGRGGARTHPRGGTPEAPRRPGRGPRRRRRANAGRGSGFEVTTRRTTGTSLLLVYAARSRSKKSHRSARRFPRTPRRLLLPARVRTPSPRRRAPTPRRGTGRRRTARAPAPG